VDGRPVRRRFALASIALVAALLVAPRGIAAQTTALVRGVVVDAQGGVLPGADVRVTKAQAGFERNAITAADGRFVIGNLPLGAYSLPVELAGFNTYARAVELYTSVPVHVTIVLEPRTFAVRVKRYFWPPGTGR